uniref:uncharacterized protein LOC120328879 n=1 Tax=Styela clava TaxID=7725 RepID=UPI001939935E|nr:uncharacterized protein LOC120328879 [Styela clava]
MLSILHKLIILVGMTSAIILCLLGSSVNLVKREEAKHGILREAAIKKEDSFDQKYLSPYTQVITSPTVLKTTKLVQISHPTTSRKMNTEQQDYFLKDVNEDTMRTFNIGCNELRKLLDEAKKEFSKTYRTENKYGNRGIYFAKTMNNSPIVIKIATIQNQSDAIEIYRYNSALREIRLLQDLQEFGFAGSPQVWGSCVSSNHVIYAVTRFVDSEPLCAGNGTDMSCAMAQNVVQKIKISKSPGTSALKFLEKATCFFSQFEKYRILMEDFSGSNFHISSKTLDFYLVDADSLIFYENVPLLSRMSCHKDSDCPKPSGNLWPSHALNRKIYYGCGEMYGICRNNTCQGIGSELHTCGVGRWLVTAVRSFIPVEVYNDYRKLKECMSESNPLRRCSAHYSCSAAKFILNKYITRAD